MYSKNGRTTKQAKTIALQWNGAPTTDLHPENPTEITIPAGESQAAVKLRAADDDNTDYNKPVKANVTATLGDVTVTDSLTVIDNDARPKASLSVPASVAEGADFKVTANLSHTMDIDTTVHFTHQNPYDIDIGGYPELPAIRVAAGSLTGESAAMRKLNDNMKDGWGDIHFSVNGTQNLGFDATRATVRITDDDATEPNRRRYLADGTPTGYVLTTAAHESGNGTLSKQLFYIKVRDARENETYTFEYETRDGGRDHEPVPAATADEDYVATSGTITFEPGVSEKTVLVWIKDDDHEDSGEMFRLVLTDSSLNAQINPGRPSGTCTILNHDRTALSATFPETTSTATSHEGTDDRPQVVAAFSEPIATIAADSASIAITGATLSSHAAHTEAGLKNAWIFTLAPSGYGDVTFALKTGIACDAGGICTDDAAPLSTAPAAHTVSGPTGLIATFSNLPAENPGTDFTFDLNFNAELTAGWRQITHAFIVDGGSIKRVSRKTRGSDLAWKVNVHPSGTGEMTISLVAPSVACGSQAAICSEEGNLPLSNRPSETVPAAGASQATPPSASIAGGTATEGTDNAISFTVTLDAAATGTVTIDYATTDGTATAGSDYTSTSGTLTFAAGTTSQTITVPIADDSVNESDETFTVTLSNASGATLGTSAATGTIANRTMTVPPSASITSGASATEGTDTSVVFTVTLDKAGTGTVTIDYATSDGTASAGSDYTSTSGTLTFAAGTTSQTITVAIADDSVNESDETFTITLSNPSGASLGTSSASATIINRYVAPPLTASFANMPAEHGGGGEANQFTFDLSFSENVRTGWRKLKERAFVLSGGHIEKVRRKARGEGTKNQHWTIWIEPAGVGDVTITLPGGRTCGAANAICTFDTPTRAISNTASATVAGPAALSVADASANENTGTGLEFPVTLGRASTLTVTVAYATSDGTATAGQDYTATSGTLTFNPGETAKTVTVALVNDAIDDGGETVTLTLSNPTNARITDGTATGTIENSDPLQRDWIARFGRTVASDVVDGITDRLASRGGGSELRVAGVTLQNSGGTWTEAPAEATEPGDALEGKRPLQTREINPGELLTQSAFRLSGPSDTRGGTAWGAWGHFSTSSFDGEAEGLTFSADVITGMLGADVGTEEWTAGIALSSAKGDGPYQMDNQNKAGCMSGTVDSTLTSVHPYAQVQLSRDVALWGVAGHGAGDMTIEDSCGASYKTDIDMTMAAAGLRGQVLKAAEGDALDMAVRSDALWLRTTSERTEDLAPAKANVTRLRLMVDASRALTVGLDGTLVPSIEAGVRHDAGDAEEGVGFEVGAGLAYQGTGITIEGKVRKLIAHDDSAYEEWGASASVRIDPGNDGRGMSLTIAPTWGDATSETEQLWSARDPSGLVRNEEFEAEQRLDAEVGYGLGAPQGFGLVTPYAGLTLADGAERTLRTGLRWNASEGATVALEASREESGEARANALMLRAQLRF